MARIRTVKPELFKHEDLFDAERETGLPLRVAFIGLWTVCDKEGRFEWRPRAIKTDVLPYDEVDFSRVLDALTTRGFVVRYRVDGKEYGVVPGFSRHQVINNREKESVLPSPPQCTDNINDSTRDPRVDDASGARQVHAQAEGEGEGEEEERSDDLLSDLPDPTPGRPDEIQSAVDAYNEAAVIAGWPLVQKMTPARRSAIRARLSEVDGLEGWNVALAKARASPHLCGHNDRGWTASFDFLTSQKSFAKLMEGNYDSRSAAARPTSGGYRSAAADDAFAERIAFAARNRSPSRPDFGFG